MMEEDEKKDELREVLAEALDQMTEALQNGTVQNDDPEDRGEDRPGIPLGKRSMDEINGALDGLYKGVLRERLLPEVEHLSFLSLFQHPEQKKGTTGSVTWRGTNTQLFELMDGLDYRGIIKVGAYQSNLVELLEKKYLELKDGSFNKGSWQSMVHRVRKVKKEPDPQVQNVLLEVDQGLSL
jgi:hypothetical protein